MIAVLSGAQKCAILVLLLEEVQAAELLRRMDAAEVRAVGEAMLSVAEIEDKFDLGYHLKHVDTIFERVFGVG